MSLDLDVTAVQQWYTDGRRVADLPASPGLEWALDLHRWVSVTTQEAHNNFRAARWSFPVLLTALSSAIESGGDVRAAYTALRDCATYLRDYHPQHADVADGDGDRPYSAVAGALPHDEHTPFTPIRAKRPRSRSSSQTPPPGPTAPLLSTPQVFKHAELKTRLATIAKLVQELFIETRRLNNDCRIFKLQAGRYTNGLLCLLRIKLGAQDTETSEEARPWVDSALRSNQSEDTKYIEYTQQLFKAVKHCKYHAPHLPTLSEVQLPVPSPPRQSNITEPPVAAPRNATQIRSCDIMGELTSLEARLRQNIAQFKRLGDDLDAQRKVFDQLARPIALALSAATCDPRTHEFISEVPAWVARATSVDDVDHDQSSLIREHISQLQKDISKCRLSTHEPESHVEQ